MSWLKMSAPSRHSLWIRCALAAACAAPLAAASSPVHATPMAKAAATGVVWFDFMVHDTDRAAAFYGAVIGVTKGPAQGAYTPLLQNGVPIGGLLEVEASSGVASAAPEGGTPEGGAGASLYFATTDLAAAVQRATSLGARVLFGPTAIHGGHGTMALLRDLDGNAFGVVQM